MSADSDFFFPSPRFDARRESDLAHPVAGPALDRRNSFAREKFLWLDQVRADAQLTPLAFMLAYVLANLVNEREGYAWPSVGRLAAECHVTEAGARKVIRRLIERGHLSVEVGTGRGKTNRYRWMIKRDSPRRAHDEQNEGQPSQYDKKTQPALPLSGRKGVTPVAPSDPERGNRGFEKGQLAFRKGVTTVTPTLSNESIYDPYYRISRQNSRMALTDFEAFWRAYPKQVARADAMRAFARAVRYAPANEIIQGAMRYAVERRGEDTRFTKHPATWLRKGCWSDECRTPQELVKRRSFDGSIAPRIHSDDDFDEVMRIQQQRKRGSKWKT
jgi:hypothetical protein